MFRREFLRADYLAEEICALECFRHLRPAQVLSFLVGKFEVNDWSYLFPEDRARTVADIAMERLLSDWKVRVKRGYSRHPNPPRAEIGHARFLVGKAFGCTCPWCGAVHKTRASSRAERSGSDRSCHSYWFSEGDNPYEVLVIGSDVGLFGSSWLLFPQEKWSYRTESEYRFLPVSTVCCGCLSDLEKISFRFAVQHGGTKIPDLQLIASFVNIRMGRTQRSHSKCRRTANKVAGATT